MSQTPEASTGPTPSGGPPPRAANRLEAIKREIGNLPNTITIGRLFLIPPVLLMMRNGDPISNFWAMMLFLLAATLDVVDGWLARRKGLVTFFGKFMDPLADKVMVTALLIELAALGRVPPYVVILLISRELYISGLRMMALREQVEIVADAGGKAKTAFQMIGICFLMLHFSYRLPTGHFINCHDVGTVFIFGGLAMAVISALSYTWGFVNAMEQRPDTGDQA